MEFFTSAIDTLKVLVIALGAGLGVWGVRHIVADKQQAIQHLCFQRYALVAAVGQKNFRDAVEAVLVGFIPVVVIQIQSFRHFQSLLSK